MFSYTRVEDTFHLMIYFHHNHNSTEEIIDSANYCHKEQLNIQDHKDCFCKIFFKILMDDISIST